MTDDDIGFVTNSISPDGIENAEFATRVRGYDRDEVDEFLALLAREVRHLVQTNGVDVDRHFEEDTHTRGAALLSQLQAATDDLRGQIEVEENAAQESEQTRLDVEQQARRSIVQAEELVEQLEENRRLAHERVLGLKHRLQKVVEKLESGEKKLDENEDEFVHQTFTSDAQGNSTFTTEPTARGYRIGSLATQQSRQ
jgi:DivIVA domain-containing protein